MIPIRIYYEAGVSYCYPENGNEPEPGMKRFEFTRTHLNSNTTTEGAIHCYSRPTFLRLLDHWSRCGWSYREKV